MTLSSRLAGIIRTIRQHAIASSLVVLVLAGGGYWTYQKYFVSTATTTYTLGTVERKTVISSISASGQVSPSDEVVVYPKASGQITAVYVKDGQRVSAGQAIAQIDATTAYQNVRNAQTSLQGAQLSLQKSQQPTDAATIAQAENQLAQAEATLASDRTTNFNDIANAFLDLPSIMTGLNTTVLGTSASRGTQWNLDYYTSQANQVTNSLDAQPYRDNAYNAYMDAKTAYDSVFAQYQSASRVQDATTTAVLLRNTYDAMQKIANAVKLSNALIQYYQDKLTARNLTPNTQSTSDLAALNTYTTKINSQLNTFLDDINNLQTHRANVTQLQLSLAKLREGTDPLDIKSSELSVQQRQDALSEAQQTLTNYTIRAPFSGTLANFSLQRGDNVGSGTAVATEIGSGNIADLSLNEVDAAKIEVGDKATLTFDAIEGLTIAGHVASVSPLGTVSQGVVSYAVKVAFDTEDARVKAGMTVNASIITDTAQNVLTVPSSAVKTTSGTRYVLVFDPALQTASGAQSATSDTAPKQVAVTTGLSDDTTIEVTSGLTEGQQIVVRTSTGTAGSSSSSATKSGSSNQNRGGGPMMF